MKPWTVGDTRQECGEVPEVPGAGDTKLLGDMRDANIERESLRYNALSSTI